MPGGAAAIDAWERLRMEGFGSTEEAGVLAGIRSVLSIAPKPASVPQKDWQALRQFIRSADDAHLLCLVRSVEWATYTTSFDLIDSEIEQQLLVSGRASSPVDSHNLYERLVIFVLNRLSVVGPKNLRPEDLNGVISEQGISSRDRQIIEILLRSEE